MRTLRDAPVLYGGGGGMDIFSDVWVYDAEAEGWLPVSPSPAVLDRGMATSLLFGTAAFVMLVSSSRGNSSRLPGAGLHLTPTPTPTLAVPSP